MNTCTRRLAVRARSGALLAMGVLAAAIALGGSRAHAQGALADYERAAALRQRVQGLVVNTVPEVTWIDDTNLWYVVERGGGKRGYVQVDAQTGQKRDLFDAGHLAAGLSRMLRREIDAANLPIERVHVDGATIDLLLRDEARVVRVQRETGAVGEVPVEQVGAFLLERAGPRDRRGRSTAIIVANRTDAAAEMFWLNGEERKSYGAVEAGGVRRQHTFGGHRWRIVGAGGATLFEGAAADLPSVVVLGAQAEQAADQPRDEPRPRERRAGRGAEGDTSTDGRVRVMIRDRNVVMIESVRERALTTEGTAEAGFAGPVQWSPDSTRFVVRWHTPAQRRPVSFVESSPTDQVQPRLHTFEYLKPGDVIEVSKPRLFDASRGVEIAVSDELFGTPWSIDRFAWAGDSSGFSFVYNQRGHQVLRLVGVTRDGEARTIIEETPETFVDYVNSLFLHRIEETGEAVWMSERGGWRHLYLVNERDVLRGEPVRITPITRGEWLVRGVDRVDEDARQVWFRAGAIHPEQDPYFIHFARVNFDGSGLMILTEGDGTHDVEYSPDRRFFIDRYSRVDMPGVVELRSAETGSLVCELERADWSALVALPWVAPQRFVAKGRDGQTDIHGVIVRPMNFDSTKKYPVVEHIYAGPHSAFVPKAFAAHMGVMHDIAELGFVVVQIDGMGTAHRHKAFHDVCWKNLGDSGFADRIAWIRAAAEKHGEMDLSRVGIFGGSAGGQSALRALLAHGDFYKVAVADCGCHDNRMDKIWWNEAWMGWPVGDHYAAQSNVTNAHRLTGKLLLIVGEMDRNVDPASTMQVVHALVKADRDFDLLVMPGVGHGAAETPYGRRRRADFLVRHLMGVEPRGR
ncbi:MAG: prolyl oligopeptidase family serine peptidase [Phycisphaeraceae bacterium]|nr:prolyl oligopeptidase family serine peptidase [Phycisphaeraceae bacterium]